MPARARPRLLRPLPGRVGRALLALSLLLAGPGVAQTITAAEYADPTTRYAHGILGDAIEHGTLELTLGDGRRLRIVLPETDVFEDTRPRLADIDGDGAPEVITVQSSLTQGARLAIYDSTGLVAATPYIGRPNRWLAPIGAADMDGDGRIEIAYIDRPHLAKTLRLWRFEQGTLVHVADLPGFTNHRIGETDIAGGLRSCAGGPEMVVATADWSALVAVRYRDGRFETSDIGSDTSRSGFARALACE